MTRAKGSCEAAGKLFRVMYDKTLKFQRPHELRLSDNSVSYQTALAFSRILAFLTLSTYKNQEKSLKSYENTTLKKLSRNFLSYGTASIKFD
jgi:hypothetical protein